MSKINSSKVDNIIASELVELEGFQTNTEYEKLYINVEHEELRHIFTTLHFNISELFRSMNTRLPTRNSTTYFWAEPSRTLIKCIEVSLELYSKLKETEIPIKIDEYYFNLFQECRIFLSNSGGSAIPEDMNKVDIYYKIPIYSLSDSVEIKSPERKLNANLKYYDEGSYANIYKYKDDFYNRYFIIKRAKKNLSSKELERFKREYNSLKLLSSPYIIEVFNYNAENNQYIMEYMDWNLYKYIQKYNNMLTIGERKRIVYQLFKAFEYIHSKDLLHRDINPNNILLKEYDDGLLIVKVSDFGLVKMNNSNLTALDTELKGRFNDPALRSIGFNKYSLVHEIYALCYTIYFIITGKTRLEKSNNENLNIFIDKGLNINNEMRPKSIEELRKIFSNI